jgi:thiol-disulfide isomerase/thioredoxin
VKYRAALLLVILLAAASVVLLVTRSASPPSVASTAAPALLPPDERVAAPDFTGVDSWINSRPLSIRALRGHVVLIDFWTFSCVNCVRTLPHLQALDRAYARRGLVMVGVHSPEFDFEKVRANVVAAVERLGVTWPVALDSQMATWRAYHNEYWPAEYLIDQQGRVAYVNFGEGAYAATDRAVASLLDVHTASVPAATPVPADITPELYAGSLRGQLADGASYGPLGQPHLYPDTGPPHDSNLIQVTGTWIDEGEYLQAAAAGTVRLNFHAGNVFVVAGTAASQSLAVAVRLDGQAVVPAASGDALRGSTLTVSRQDLFQLLRGVGPGYHALELTVPAGFQLYTFTFG